jgi:hypothetical protein
MSALCGECLHDSDAANGPHADQKGGLRSAVRGEKIAQRSIVGLENDSHSDTTAQRKNTKDDAFNMGTR